MKNGPHLSRLLDPPGTKGGPQAHFRRGPPKYPFVPGGGTTRDQRESWLYPGPKGGPFGLGSSHHLGPKTPLVPGGGWNRDQRLPPYISRRPSPLPPPQHLVVFLIRPQPPPVDRHRRALPRSAAASSSPARSTAPPRRRPRPERYRLVDPTHRPRAAIPRAALAP